MTRRLIAAAASLAASLTLAACNLDISNPNAATEQTVLNSAAGLRAVAVGLQGRFGNALAEAVWIPGLVSGELGTTNSSLSQQREFQRFPDAGANTPRIEPINSDLLNFWSRHYLVVRSADDLLNNLTGATLAPGTAAGMRALANGFKGYALGTLAEAWEQVPVDISGAQSPFVPRAQALTTALDLLQTGLQDLSTAPSAEFTNDILLAGVDLPNTLRTWQARFALSAGQYQAALAAANAVPANATSEFRFSSTDQNPLWSTFTASGYFGVIASYRADAEAGDTRVARYTKGATLSAFGGASLNAINVFAAPAEAFPLIQQDELALIRAEAIVRGGLAGDAIAQINAVRQRAGLAARTAGDFPNQAALLGEILKQRQYSLVATGVRWADLRRFGAITQARATWLPYPEAERANNPNTPANP